MDATEIRDQIIVVADERLRPKDRKVFLLLAKWAIEKPTEFLPMSQIASAGWEDELDQLQIKNNVQRAIYEIRQQFGRDAIIRQANNYRLDLNELDHRLRQKDRSTPDREFEPRGSAAGFTQRIGAVLAQASGATTLNRLLLWGPQSLLGMIEHSSPLYDAIRSRRLIQVGSGVADGRLAVDVVKALLYSTDGIGLRDLHKQCAGSFHIALARACLGSGICWIDHQTDRSFVEHAGLGGALIRVGEGSPAVSVSMDFVRCFLPDESATHPLIVVDRLDQTLSGYVELLRNCYLADAGTSQVPLDLLAGYSYQIDGRGGI
jgi:hypothetical protein